MKVLYVTHNLKFHLINLTITVCNCVLVIFCCCKFYITYESSIVDIQILSYNLSLCMRKPTI